MKKAEANVIQQHRNCLCHKTEEKSSEICYHVSIWNRRGRRSQRKYKHANSGFFLCLIFYNMFLLKKYVLMLGMMAHTYKAST